MVGPLLETLAEKLGKSEARYCLLHGWQSLSAGVTSDLDLIIAPDDLPVLEETLHNNGRDRLVQLLQYETTCFFFIVSHEQDGKVAFTPIDATTEYRRDGRVYLTADELLKDRQQWQEFWVAGPEAEYAYLLTKKVSKSAVPTHQRVRLQELQAILGEKAHVTSRRVFGSHWGTRLMGWLARSEWSTLDAHLPHLRRALRWQVVKQDPLNPVRYWLPELWRIWQRWRYPTGLFVAVLGPDGAGKSTLVQHLREDLAGAFRQTEVCHLRPDVLGQKRTNGPVTDPHGKPPYPLWLSLSKLFYYLLDYSCGYLLKVRPKLVKSTLVLFDRYYDDLLVDPHRYRYGGPPRALHYARRFAPRPDMFLILDVPEEQLLARKQELSRDELRRQRAAYLQLAAELPNALLLDGSLPAETVARTASAISLDYLQERYAKRRPLWFHNEIAETLKWLSSVLCCPEQAHFALGDPAQDIAQQQWKTQRTFGWLSLKDGRGYLLPLDSRAAAVNALQLYNAQNLKARVAKKVLSSGIKWGIARPFLQNVQVLIRQDVPEEDKSRILLLEHLKTVLGRHDLTFAVSLGTSGPHRKPTVQVLTQEGTIVGYAKVGWDQETNALVQNEAEMSRRLTRLSFTSFQLPSLLHAGWWREHFLCLQAAPEGKVEPAPRTLTTHYFAVLNELSTVNIRWLPLRHSTFWTGLGQRIESLANPYSRHILQQGTSKAAEWLGDRPLPFHVCHGDFAPWNAQLQDGRLFLFDWEYAQWEAPPGLDLCHFLVQTAWLLNNQSPRQILATLQGNDGTAQRIREYLEKLGVDVGALRPLFLLYLVEKLALSITEGSVNFRAQRYLTALINLCMSEEQAPSWLNA